MKHEQNSLKTKVTFWMMNWMMFIDIFEIQNLSFYPAASILQYFCSFGHTRKLRKSFCHQTALTEQGTFHWEILKFNRQIV